MAFDLAGVLLPAIVHLPRHRQAGSSSDGPVDSSRSMRTDRGGNSRPGAVAVAARRPRRSAARGCGRRRFGLFGDAHVGINPSRRFFQIHADALFNTGLQTVGKLLVDLVADVDQQPRMNVAPMLFEIGVHSWKWALHDRTNAVEGRYRYQAT